ncbi:hypothetical protein FRC10_002082, partial [Ceratobasidium sp. 414]
HPPCMWGDLRDQMRHAPHATEMHVRLPLVRELGFRLGLDDVPAASALMLLMVMEPAQGQGQGGGDEYEGEEDEYEGEEDAYEGEEDEYGGGEYEGDEYARGSADGYVGEHEGHDADRYEYEYEWGVGYGRANMDGHEGYQSQDEHGCSVVDGDEDELGLGRRQRP